jgi:hypothetical protein
MEGMGEDLSRVGGGYEMISNFTPQNSKKRFRISP